MSLASCIMQRTADILGCFRRVLCGLREGVFGEEGGRGRGVVECNTVRKRKHWERRVLGREREKKKKVEGLGYEGGRESASEEMREC